MTAHLNAPSPLTLISRGGGSTPLAVPKPVRLAYSLLRAQADRPASGDDNAVAVASRIMLTAALRGAT